MERWIAGSIGGSVDRWIGGSMERWIAGSIAGSVDQ